MKKYFLNLFGYDFYANKIIFRVITNAQEVAKPVELMTHIFSVNQVWYDRCRVQQPSPGQVIGNKNDPYGGIIEPAKAYVNYISQLIEKYLEQA